MLRREVLTSNIHDGFRYPCGAFEDKESSKTSEANNQGDEDAVGRPGILGAGPSQGDEHRDSGRHQQAVARDIDAFELIPRLGLPVPLDTQEEPEEEQGETAEREVDVEDLRHLVSQSLTCILG